MGWLTFRKKRNTYYYRYNLYIGDRKKEESINLETDNRALAEKYKEEFDEKIEQGKNPAALKKVSLADYIPHLKREKSYRSLSTATLDIYDSVCQQLLEYEISRVPIKKLKKDDVSKFLRDLHYSHSYTTKWKNTIKQLLDFAVMDGVILRNFMPDVKINWVKQSSKTRIFTDQELRKIWAEADRLDQLKGTSKGKLYRLLYYTGMRRSEAIFFHRDYYIREMGIIQYPASTVKSRVNTTKYLNPKAIEIIEWYLKTYPEYDMPILRDNSPRWYPGSMTTHFRRLLKRLKIKDATIHTFRHTHITRLASDPNNALLDVQGVVGHQDVRTTMRYSHPQDRHMREAVNRLPVVEEE